MRYIIAIVFCLFAIPAQAATYYLAPDGSDSGNGSISEPWKSLDYALNKYRNDSTTARVAPGDILNLRGGVYDVSAMSTNSGGPYIFLGGDNSISSPTTTIQTYPADFSAGNVAILDGTGVNSCLRAADTGKQYNVLFQNIEVRNAERYGFDMREDVGFGPTMMVGCSFRNMYFHDNNHIDYNLNPTGLMLAGESCVVEYCTFEDNGTTGSSHLNSSNLALLNSYNSDLGSIDPEPRKNNIIRYNRFLGSAVGIKDKGDSNFIANNTRTNSHPEWANEIHHNIFKGQASSGYYLQQDYVKVYNNVFDTTNIGVFYDSYDSTEKTVWEPEVYNNTFINNADSAIAVEYGPYAYGWDWDIRDNLFLETSTHYLVFLSGQTNVRTMTSNYNGFDTTQTVVGRYLNNGNVNYATWQGYGFDANSTSAAMAVTNSAANDYTLPVGSSAIGAGTGEEDIGAFEYGGSNWYLSTGYSSATIPTLTGGTVRGGTIVHP